MFILLLCLTVNSNKDFYNKEKDCLKDCGSLFPFIKTIIFYTCYTKHGCSVIFLSLAKNKYKVSFYFLLNFRLSVSLLPIALNKLFWFESFYIRILHNFLFREK